MVDKPNGAQYHYLITDQPQFARNRLKLLVIGSKGCGKTAFVGRLSKGVFADEDDSATNPQEGPSKQVFQYSLPEGLCLKIELVDIDIDQLSETAKNVNIIRQRLMSGEDVSPEYSEFVDASGVFVLYDITNNVSFNCLSSILGDLSHLVAPDCEVFLVGCKGDLKHLRKVPFDQAEKFSLKVGLSLIETSSKTGLNCAAALHELVDKVYEKREEAEAYICDSIEEAEPVESISLTHLFCQTWSCG